jgi:hypothetical protein
MAAKSAQAAQLARKLAALGQEDSGSGEAAASRPPESTKVVG